MDSSTVGTPNMESMSIHSIRYDWLLGIKRVQLFTKISVEMISMQVWLHDTSRLGVVPRVSTIAVLGK